MSIVKFSENYFLRLYDAHHKIRLTSPEKIKTALVILSCFTLVIPGFFAVIYGLSGLLGRGKTLKVAPKEVQLIAKKIERAVPDKPREADPLPLFLVQFPKLKREGFSAQNYIRTIAQFYENEGEELLKCAAQFHQMESPDQLYLLLQTMKSVNDPGLCEQVCKAFAPVFHDLPEQLIKPAISEIIAHALSAPRCKNQIHQTARAMHKLFVIPNQAEELQKMITKLFDCWITEDVFHLIEEQIQEPPKQELAWIVLEGLCPSVTNIQSSAREKGNFTFLMASPELNHLELSLLDKHLYCRLVARQLFSLHKKELPPIALHLIQQIRDFSQALAMMKYVHAFYAPITPEEFYRFFDLIRPYPQEHLDFVYAQIHEYLMPTELLGRREAASAALNVHKDELAHLVAISKELFYDSPEGFVLLAKIPMPKRQEIIDLFKEEVLGNGLLAEFPEKSTAYPVIQQLSEMDPRVAKTSLAWIADKFQKPIEGKMLAALIKSQPQACDTH